MQNILVPTDFSKNAYHALLYATELFQTKSCNFILLNVYKEKKGFKVKPIKDDKATDQEELMTASLTKLGRIKEKIAKEQGNLRHRFELVSRPANLVQVVHDLVDKFDIDLIILGAKGVKSSIPLFLGSTALETMRSIKKCPILVVPKVAEIAIPKEITFATDYQNPFNAPVLESLSSIALLCRASLRILHIDEEEKLNDAQQKNLSGFLTYLQPLAISLDQLPNFISKAKVIQFFLEESGSEMLAMVNNDRGVLEKMLREPVVEKMVLKVEIPFLIIPDYN